MNLSLAKLGKLRLSEYIRLHNQLYQTILEPTSKLWLAKTLIILSIYNHVVSFLSIISILHDIFSSINHCIIYKWSCR